MGTKMNFNNFTQEQLQSARNYAAELPDRISKECFSETFGFASHVTYEDKVAYSNDNKKNAQAIRAGDCDHNFTIAQRMYYFLTGEDVPLMSK